MRKAEEEHDEITVDLQPLPEGWIWSNLGAIGLARLGKTPGKADYRDSGEHKIVKFRDVDEYGQVDWDNTNKGYVDSSPEVLRTLKELRDGDVLVTASAHMSEHIGKKVGIVRNIPSKYKAAYVVGEILQIRMKKEIDPRWVLYYLRSTQGYKAIQRRVHGVHLIASRAQNIELPIAPLDQQKRIVAKIEKQFSRLDEAVANLKRVKANLKRYKAAVLKAAVEGRLVETEAEIARREGRSYESGEQLLQRILETRRSQWQGKGKYKEPAAPDTTDLPALPEGWVWANFDQVAERVTKGSSPNWQGFEYCQEGIPFVRSQNVGWGVTDLSDIAYLPHGFNNVEKKSVLREGDVLLNIVGASIGRTAIAPSAVEGGNVNQAVAVIRLFASVVRNEFVLFYLLSAQTQRRIHAEKVDVARANFSLEDIREMPLALPPRGEQDRIVAEVDRRLSILDETQTQVDVNLRRAERMRAAILVNAFTRRHSRGTVGVVAINVES